MAHHIGQGLPHDGQEGELQPPVHLPRVVVQLHRAECEIAQHRLQLHMQIHRLVVEIVDAAPDAVHGPRQRVPHGVQPLPHRFVPVDHLQRPHLQQGAGEQMPYVVVDLPGDPVALVEGGQPHLVILLVQQLPVLPLQMEGQFPGAVLRLLVLATVPQQPLGAQPEQQRRPGENQHRHGQGRRDGSQPEQHRRQPQPIQQPAPAAEAVVGQRRQEGQERPVQAAQRGIQDPRRQPEPLPAVGAQRAQRHRGQQRRHVYRPHLRAVKQQRQPAGQQYALVRQPSHDIPLFRYRSAVFTLAYPARLVQNGASTGDICHARL